MAKQKPKQPELFPKLEPEQEEPQVPTFTEIGGSPVPGLTLRQVLRGHTGWIGKIAWSPDGQRLASPSDDKTIRIWDTHSGTCVHTLEGHTKAVNSAAWSSDGQRLASASADNTIRLWDTASGKHLQTLEGHTSGVKSVAWSPDGQRLASASDDNTIRLWDAASGKSMQKLEGHTNSVQSVAWSPDSQRLASASGDNTIRLWDAASGKPLQTLEGHTHWVHSVSWSPDGQRLASASVDKTIRLWDAISGKALQVLEGHSVAVGCVMFSGDGQWLASKSWGNDNTVRLWNCDTWACTAIISEQAHSFSQVLGLTFHPSQLVLATLGEKDTIIRIWELDEALLLGQAKESVHYTTAKLVLVGDSGVGKTGLGWRLAHGEFKEHASTHGQQFWSIPQLGLKRKDGTECEAVLWDLAGQHVYRQIHSLFLDNVAAALVLFDPSNRQEPLKGVEFWLEQLKGKAQLPPAVLVGARVDVSPPTLSQQEFDQFCQRHGIRGGYLSTSALSGEGLDALLEKLKAQIPWDEMTATVTTVTFKRIKDYVLALKEKTDRKGVLVSPAELRDQLETCEVSETSQVWEFTDAEMMTAVGHLETHGYVAVLRGSEGEQHILLTPDLLVSLAASIVLLADKNPRELGAVSETELLQGQYPFEELKGLEKAEQQILLDAAILRFLEHNICFRETLGSDTLLIFPSLIKQKRPLQDDLPAIDDISYVVRGRVENLYASLVVLLGYTPSFNRINQWQNQAQYEMGASEICGFRLIEERAGEIELVLYYTNQMPSIGRTQFQELFEQFLYQRDVEVTRFPPVACLNGHRQERATVIKRVREGKREMHCDECGSKIALPDFEKPQTIGIGASAWLQREEAMARLRSAYEVHLTRVKSYRRTWAAPRCYLSRLPEQAPRAEKLIHDLRDAGVYVVEQAAQVQPDDFVIVLDTPAYQKAFNTPLLAAAAPLVRARFGKRQLISLKLAGQSESHELENCPLGDFSNPTHYPVSLFDLVLNLYAISFEQVGFASVRQALHHQWEETLAGRNEEVWETLAEGAEAIETIPISQEADVVILTILPEEYQAVCQKLGSVQPAPSRNDHRNLYAWKVGQVGSDESAYSVAVGMMGRAGTTESALATRDAIERWNPRYVFFVGIAGGLKNLNKGDVVIADVIYGYEYGKIEKTFTPRSNWTYKTDIGLLNGAVAHTKNWQAGITAQSPQLVSPKAVKGEIASGDKVVDDPSHAFFAEVLKTWPKIIAVEMEGAGAGNAIEQTQALGKAVSYMMIRGISDLPRPSSEKPQAEEAQGTAERDTWKAYAADTAAAFVVSFIASGLSSPPR